MSSPLRSLLRFQDSGLLFVILALGLLLAAFSGTVRIPLFERNADGSRQRVFTTDADGERVPATVEKNKFRNAPNLAPLAKDTNFLAIMAVGMAVVIIAGGLDLSVGAIYALASMLGALVIQMISSGIVIFGIDQNYSQIIIVTVVIVAVVFDNFNPWLSRRRLTQNMN